jgi:hypothetical protein
MLLFVLKNWSQPMLIKYVNKIKKGKPSRQIYRYVIQKYNVFEIMQSFNISQKSEVGHKKTGPFSFIRQ